MSCVLVNVLWKQNQHVLYFLIYPSIYLSSSIFTYVLNDIYYIETAPAIKEAETFS
jgi:hypothetical protein